MSEELCSRAPKKELCGICNENESKYCCPRCEILYCSVHCYKSEKHITCSENFYRDCVNEELASYQNDGDSRQKMIDILKRMQESDIGKNDLEELIQDVKDIDDDLASDSDDDDGIDLHERIQGLNLDDADAVWDVLNEDERNEFEAMLNGDNVSELIIQWTPWWMYNKKEQLVQDVDYKDVGEEDALKKCPLIKNVPQFDSLTKVKPSPAIRYNIVNVISSYAFVARYFNGELDPIEATTYLLNVCANLDTNANFDEVEIAVDSVAQKCLQSVLIQTDEVSLDIMKNDTFWIIQGPSEENKIYYLKAALSHILTIFSEAKSASKSVASAAKEKKSFSKKFPEHTTEHLPPLDISKVKKCIKKVEYYMSYVESYGLEF